MRTQTHIRVIQVYPHRNNKMESNVLFNIINNCPDTVDINNIVKLLAPHNTLAKLITRINYIVKPNDSYNTIKSAAYNTMINELKSCRNITDFDNIASEYNSYGITNDSCITDLDETLERLLIGCQSKMEIIDVLNICSLFGVLLATRMKSDLCQHNVATNISLRILNLLRNSNITEVHQFAYEQYASKTDYDITELLDINNKNNIVFSFIQTCIQFKNFNTDNHRINAFKKYYSVLEEGNNTLDYDDTFYGMNLLCNIVIDKRNNVFKITDMVSLLDRLIKTDSNMKYIVHHYLGKAYPEVQGTLSKQYQSVNDIDFSVFYKNHINYELPTYILV